MDAIKPVLIVPVPAALLAEASSMGDLLYGTLSQPVTCSTCGKPLPSLGARLPAAFGGSDDHAECQRIADERRKAAAQTAYETARAEWQAVRDQHASVPALVAVLDLHAPALGHDGAVCGDCTAPDGAGGAMAYPWTCPTFEAIKGAS